MCRQAHPVLKGWSTYFRHDVSYRTFSYVEDHAVRRILGWLCKRRPRLGIHTLVRRHFPNWEVRAGRIELFRPTRIGVERYRYRGAQIPTPWTKTTGSPAPTA